MWKLYIKITGNPDWIFIPDTEVGTDAGAQHWRHGTDNAHKGFTLMSGAVSYMLSAKFVKYIGSNFKDDAEITEVKIAFEDII